MGFFKKAIRRPQMGWTTAKVNSKKRKEAVAIVWSLPAEIGEILEEIRPWNILTSRGGS